MNNEELEELPKSRPRPLVCGVLTHPKGAYMWQKKYDPSIIPYIPELYEGGRTDVQVAVDIGICESTFYDWIKQYPAFASAVKYGKSISKAAMSEVGIDAAKGYKKIDGKVWHIMMRNCHGYDKVIESEEERLAKEKQDRINQRTKELLDASTE